MSRPAPGQRELDLALLHEVLHREELPDHEREPFENMRDALEAQPYRMTGAPRALSPKQRLWVEAAAERLGISVARNNEDVPVGAPVETPEVLRHLPKRPPGRRTAV